MIASEFAKASEKIQSKDPCKNKKCNHTPDEHNPLLPLQRRENRGDTAMRCRICMCPKYQ